MRFGFGKNWQSYLKTLDENKIKSSEKWLLDILSVNSLEGKRFIDIGSGSGLMSLAARNMGADVFSFDYDENSVAATKQLKSIYYPTDDKWNVESGSVLDKDYLSSKGKFDIVYSWGVLHHTGNMWQALENVIDLVNTEGILYIAIYNDQGYTSKTWKLVKRTYNTNFIGKLLMTSIYVPYFYLLAMITGVIQYKNPFYSIKNYKVKRGMNVYNDVIDWIGGYPFEVATPGKIFHFFKERGFILKNLKTTTSLGCNEYIFTRVNDDITISQLNSIN